MKRTCNTSAVRRILAVLGCSAVCVLSAWPVAWATTKCHVPNPSTKFCFGQGKSIPTNDCTKATGACGAYQMLDRNQFPDGEVDAASGSTTEEEADCYRTQSCVTDPNNPNKCVAQGTWSRWFKEDKVVPGGNPCPTKEG